MPDFYSRLPKGVQRFLSQRDIKVIIAVFAPPLAVYLHVGFEAQLWLNIALTLLAYVPGLVHAVWIINKAQ